MRTNGIIVAIDGPVGSGKSSTAKGVAQALGYLHLNTGAMYRAFALLVREEGGLGVAADDPRIHQLITAADISFAATGAVTLSGRDVSREIQDPEIALLASRFSAVPEVRARLVEKQRAMGAAGGVVLEGRDIGTVVFPDAELKIFLVADLHARAERRQRELSDMGTPMEVGEVERQIAERDRRDREREISPLLKADDAVELDTTTLTLDGQIGEVVRLARERIARG